MLTPKQKRLLDYIRSFQERKGYNPSQQEIAEHFGYKSLGTVQNFLVRLEKQGLLRKTWNSKRGMELIDRDIGKTLAQDPHHPSGENVLPLTKQSSLILSQKEENSGRHTVPLPITFSVLGRVAAGKPIDYTETGTEIDVPPSFFRTPERASENHFVLRVKGDSMVGDGILDGDFVVIKKQPDAEAGQTVVALVGSEATIKRYYKTKAGGVELRAANPAYDPILIPSLTEAQSFKIEGVLVGVLRKF